MGAFGHASSVQVPCLPMVVFLQRMLLWYVAQSCGPEAQFWFHSFCHIRLKLFLVRVPYARVFLGRGRGFRDQRPNIRSLQTFKKALTIFMCRASIKLPCKSCTDVIIPRARLMHCTCMECFFVLGGVCRASRAKYMGSPQRFLA